jgi:hypothetical protein
VQGSAGDATQSIRPGITQYFEILSTI